MTGRRASRAEVKRRVQAARDDAGNVADLPAPLARILDGYVPDRCDSDAWTAIRPTVRTVMERSASRSPAPFRKQLGALVAYLRWRHSSGLDVAVSSAMTFAAIDDFYRRVGDRYEQTTRNDYRSRLRRLAQQVNPGIDAPPRVALGHQQVRPGYSEVEQATIRRVALRQRRPPIRRQLCLIVGLVMGAGIPASDLRFLRTTHVVDEGDRGIRVDVPGKRPRTVWVRVDFEDLVRIGTTGVQPGHLLIGKKADRRKVTGTVLEQADLFDFDELDVARMRTTWLTWIITQPVPVAVVLYAAGLTSARTLTELARYTRVAPNAARQLREDAG